MTNYTPNVAQLQERSRQVLQRVVDGYLESGEPIGSRTISRQLGGNWSSATIRNDMQSLQDMGLLQSPHGSAGRVPTQQGLRLYVDGLMQVSSDVDQAERAKIDEECSASGQSIKQIMGRATAMISGLSSQAGLVVAPKTNKAVRQIQFTRMDPSRVMVILVMSDGVVENRLMAIDPNVPDSSLNAASNYLNERLGDLTLLQVAEDIHKEISEHKAQLDEVTADLVRRGIALPSESGAESDYLIVSGQTNLLTDLRAADDVKKVQQLLTLLEDQKMASELLASARGAEGVKIYIGSENTALRDSGWSMVLSPYKDSGNQIVGAIGVIGPVRMNYGRVIPIVDYTSQVLSRVIGGKAPV